MKTEPNQELETKLAFLERHIEEQDRVILKLRQQVDTIDNDLSQLKIAHQDSSSASQNMPDEKPPHY